MTRRRPDGAGRAAVPCPRRGELPGARPDRGGRVRWFRAPLRRGRAGAGGRRGVGVGGHTAPRHGLVSGLDLDEVPAAPIRASGPRAPPLAPTGPRDPPSSRERAQSVWSADSTNLRGPVRGRVRTRLRGSIVSAASARAISSPQPGTARSGSPGSTKRSGRSLRHRSDPALDPGRSRRSDEARTHRRAPRAGRHRTSRGRGPHAASGHPSSEAAPTPLADGPTLPERFDSREDTRALGARCYRPCRFENGHRDAGCYTLTWVHLGSTEAVPGCRATVLETACPAHPARCVRGAPIPPALPTAVCINRVKEPQIIGLRRVSATLIGSVVLSSLPARLGSPLSSTASVVLESAALDSGLLPAHRGAAGSRVSLAVFRRRRPS